jgi:hypothetical protein
VVDLPNRIGRVRLTQDRDGTVGVVAPDQIDDRGELVEPGLDRCAKPLAVLELNRVVARKSAQRVDIGSDARGCRFVLGEKALLASRTALSAVRIRSSKVEI